MPILWRYLLGNYLKVFGLCLLSFVAILMTMRLGEIASFATMGPQGIHLLLFALQQIPYILPIAFPVSALISSTLLMQNLSNSQELTAMRACGFSLKEVLTPVLIAAVFLSIVNFYTISELSTSSHLNSGRLKNQLRAVNPLLLVQNKHIMQMKGFYFDAFGPSKVGEFADDIIFATPNKHGDRINLVVAKRVSTNPDQFESRDLTMLTSRDTKNIDAEDVLIENIGNASSSIEDFAGILEKKIWKINNDHLRLPLLLARMDEKKAQYQKTIKENAPAAAIKEAKHEYYKTITELFRRISVGASVFAFTLMGLCFGINISRNRSSKGLIWIVLLGSLYLVSFFVGKNFDHALLFSILFSIVPLFMMILPSFWVLSKASRGIE